MSENKDELNQKEEELNIPEEELSTEAEAPQEQQEAQVELSEEEKQLQEIEALKEENSTLKDQYLRKQADFENYRKRMIREKEDSVKYGNSALLTDLVEIIDNFERAIQSGEASSDFQTFHDGIHMIEQQFSSMLANKYCLEKIEAEGELYDPNLHEALMMEDSEEVEEPTVSQVFQTGYKLHQRVLRPAKVKMARPVVLQDKKNKE
ncbi:MAG: nucleotide exchange factor GrpE [Spirochaetaceae bacterium]|jgi:molecular chaperone GrpE|nr:nucleotide exchange factor GrpE [Spirochaetaceae bacterium]